MALVWLLQCGDALRIDNRFFLGRGQLEVRVQHRRQRLQLLGREAVERYLHAPIRAYVVDDIDDIAPIIARKFVLRFAEILIVRIDH